VQANDIKRMIEAGLEECEATVTGDGSHFEAVVVGDVFAGKSLLEKQKMVYATVTDSITSGALHALTIKAYTKEEWQKAQKLNVMGS
jgi:acid stress-induced BolA-like protein IbaG/YrbA